MVITLVSLATSSISCGIAMALFGQAVGEVRNLPMLTHLGPVLFAPMKSLGHETTTTELWGYSGHYTYIIGHILH